MPPALSDSNVSSAGTDRDEFFDQLMRIERAAFHYGSDARPLRSAPGRPFRDSKHPREFLRACHRGFSKAQKSGFELLVENAKDMSIHADERSRRELLVRKVIDGLLFTMVAMQTWITRRVSLHDTPPALDFAVIERALATAERLNSADRLKFAVVADLSTFVHVCDLVQAAPLESPSLKFIELKGGRVNEVLTEQLNAYPPVPESLDALKEDPAVAPRHRKQAERMLRQRIRLEQTREIIATDRGVDIKTNRPMRMNHDLIHEESYRRPLIEACERSIKEGIAAFRVNHCLHFGVTTHGATVAARKVHAIRAALYGFQESVKDASIELKSHYAAMGKLSAGEFQPFGLVDLVRSNLEAVPANSFFTWNLPASVLRPIVRNEMNIHCLFDLAAFFYVAEMTGLKATLSTRKEAEKVFAVHGRHGSPVLGGRLIKLTHPTQEGESLLLGGAVGRFINNIHSPMSFLAGVKSHWKEMTSTDRRAR